MSGLFFFFGGLLWESARLQPYLCLLCRKERGKGEGSNTLYLEGSKDIRLVLLPQRTPGLRGQQRKQIKGKEREGKALSFFKEDGRMFLKDSALPCLHSRVRRKKMENHSTVIIRKVKVKLGAKAALGGGAHLLISP